MALSMTQRFLLEADNAANPEGYFDARSVGVSLGYTALQSESAVRSLGERKMLIPLTDSKSRLLRAGRDLAIQLNAKLLARPEKPRV
jgi:hypothetical protein